MTRYKLPEVKYYTVNLLDKWTELDCDGDRIGEFLSMVEKWYSANVDKNSPLSWCWTYDPDFEFIDAGIIGITFNGPDYAADFRDIFGYVEQG